MQLTQNWRDVVASSSSGEKPSGGILDRLNFADEAVRQAANYNSPGDLNAWMSFLAASYVSDLRASSQ